ncbi:LOW QUALITY PROTEIN: marginal zone B- and B1-cell-specific protein [Petromyzon marinus]|uniref:LOW QUALITY PROTEIN: marginal zone B- and B1-cell-specific protein n=1 Tax=Petromyzon marinus TaxID=7757 RepID=UPI003F6F610D
MKMTMKMTAWCCCCWCLAVCALLSPCGAAASKDAADGLGTAGGTLSFQTPELSDEEGHSQHMPQHLRCDACRAIAYQMQEHLSRAVQKRELPESELLDTMEQCCSQSWNDYGVKELSGQKRLSGPGLEAQDAMGMMMGGGKWPFRLLQMCHALLGELGEEEIYAAFRSAAPPGQGLAPWLCQRDCGAQGAAQRDVTPLSREHTEM